MAQVSPSWLLVNLSSDKCRCQQKSRYLDKHMDKRFDAMPSTLQTGDLSLKVEGGPGAMPSGAGPQPAPPMAAYGEHHPHACCACQADRQEEPCM